MWTSVVQFPHCMCTQYSHRFSLLIGKRLIKFKTRFTSRCQNAWRYNFTALTNFCFSVALYKYILALHLLLALVFKKLLAKLSSIFLKSFTCFCGQRGWTDRGQISFWTSQDPREVLWMIKISTKKNLQQNWIFIKFKNPQNLFIKSANFCYRFTKHTKKKFSQLK